MDRMQEYMKTQVAGLKMKSNRELNELEHYFANVLFDKPLDTFLHFRNYLEHVRCERAERIGR